MTTNKINWARDDGYSGEYTAHLGDFAAVILPPYYTEDGRWGIQIFNEADDEAIECGEVYASVYGIPSEEGASRVGRVLLEELTA